MRSLRRLGVIAATTALAGTSALAGVGMAGAQNSTAWRLDSPSTVFVERDEGGDLVVSYDNRSNHDLLCYAYIGTPRTVEVLYDVHVEAGFSGDLDIFPPATDVGTIGEELGVRGVVGVFALENGASGPVTFVNPEEGQDGDVVLVPTPLQQPSDKAFSPEIVTVCAFSEDGDDGLTYAELETSSTGGGGSGGGGDVFGSLADLSGSLGS
ncbi:hypothetical protein R3P82_06800 [Dietzia maris]|uniref:Secreted protein n=1 Tax=Dietzia maris TaxID=37915 RepID=A0AAE4R0N2_9ACTN|nr:hypothetical protein [Dietzia maris]MDV6298821.1 hypothetical protein [Dietzia maris]